MIKGMRKCIALPEPQNASTGVFAFAEVFRVGTRARVSIDGLTHYAS